MRPATWTLRTRLVMAILGLTTVALVLSNVIGITLLTDNLTKRVDAQLAAFAKAVSAKPLVAFPAEQAAVTTDWVQLLSKRIEAVQQIRVYAPDGTLRFGGPTDESRPGPVIDEVRAGDTYTVPGTVGSSWRIRAVELSKGDIVVVAQSLEELEQTRTSAVAIAVVVSAAVLLLLGLAANAVVRLGLRPLTRMESTAGHIARGDFSRRVRGQDPHTEPGRLARAMNVMLDRLESEIAARTDSEARMRRFLADASHELRTPLTSVRGFAELHRRGGGDADEAMRRIEDEAARMGVLVNDLLTLAQLDEERPLDRGPVDLLEVAADTIRDARVRVPDRQVRLAGVNGALAPVSVVGDEARLRQVAANLVGNALCHTPPDAAITVRVGRSAGTAVLEVADTGPGAAIVRAHGGRVDLDTAPGRGAAFRVFLPDSEAAPSRH